jgi:type I restriction enzyme S subunit
MQRLLTGKVRFSTLKQSHRCYDSRFGLIPEQWKVVELGTVVNPITRPTSVEPEQQYRLIGVRWYGEGAHIHDIVNGSNIQTSTLSQIREGDILYNKMWTTKAAFAIAKTAHDGAYGSTEYPQFIAQQDHLDIRFLEYIFHLPRFKRDAINLCRGTTGRARLNPQDFLTLEIPLPPIEEQKKIATLLNCSQEEITLLQQKLAALRQQKKGLMQQLLTRKIRVKV